MSGTPHRATPPCRDLSDSGEPRYGAPARGQRGDTSRGPRTPRQKAGGAKARRIFNTPWGHSTFISFQNTIHSRQMLMAKQSPPDGRDSLIE